MFLVFNYCTCKVTKLFKENSVRNCINLILLIPLGVLNG